MRIAEKGPKSKNSLLISLLSGNSGWRPVAVECVRHHAVLRNAGFLWPVELSLTVRGLGDGVATDPSLCRSEEAAVAPKSPLGLCLCETVSRRELAALTETGSTADYGCSGNGTMSAAGCESR